MHSLVLLAYVLSASFAKVSAVSTTFSNSNTYEFDTNGNLIDLTSAKIDFFNGTYIWYGLPYGCGSLFCGITSYSSPDLKSWYYNGYILDPTTPSIQTLCELGGNCGRPHIVYSTSTKKYVLWVNAGAPGYVTFSSGSPTTGYVQNAARATLGFQPPGPYQGGDFTTEVINGTGYLVYALIDFTTLGASIWPPFNQSLYLQALTPSLTQTTGPVSHILTNGDYVDYEAESPDIFYRAPYYYISASNTCGWCDGTLLIIYRSKSISGPWTRQIISADTCGGQTTQVLTLSHPSGGPATYLSQADLFATSPLTGIRMATHGHQFQTLGFNSDGSVRDLDCSPSRTFTVSLSQGTAPTTGLAVSSTDNSGLSATYTGVCDIPKYALYQTWTSSKSGTLKEVGVNIAGDRPTANLSITVFRYQAEANFFTPHYIWETLASASIAPADISATLAVIRVPVNVAVKRGDKLGFALVSAGITPICTARANHTQSGSTLYAFGINQVSYRGKDGMTPPTQTFKGQTTKWYAIVA